MKGLIVQLIREEYQPLLQLPADLSEEVWARAVAQADPVLFYLNDGLPLIQIGEAATAKPSAIYFPRRQSEREVPHRSAVGHLCSWPTRVNWMPAGARGGGEGMVWLREINGVLVGILLAF
jgi:hypothetical protein